jgi:hypothetical protein
MSSNDAVTVFAIFIGSLGDQAQRLKQQLPSGRTYICQNTTEIPNILQQIFAATLLEGSRNSSD